MSLDLERLSPAQKEILEKLWSVCIYLQAARRYAPESVLAAQALNIGSLMDDIDKEEGRKNKSSNNAGNGAQQ